jgi:hypothetical protein
MANIQKQAGELGGMRQELSRTNVDTQLQAQNRAKEISQIKDQSRREFTAQQEAEKALTEGRLDDVVANWDNLPNYFKELITKQGGGTLNLNPYEAAMLGVSSGEGLYNLGADAVKSGIADKGSLVSKDEVARQQALANLAGLATDQGLDQTMKYSADKAGTQTAADALDIQGTRAGFNEAEQSFRTQAEAANLVGSGSKKVSRGNAFGKKTKTYNATVENNVADMLRNAGYDMNSEIGQNAARSILSDDQAMSNFLTGANTERSGGEDGTLAGAASGAATGASLGSIVPGVGTAIGAAAGGLLGGTLGGGSIDPYQQMTDMMGSLGLGGVADVIQDGRKMAGDAAEAAVKYNPMAMVASALGGGSLVNSLASGIGGAIGGINTKAMKQYGDAIAKRNAISDLQNKYKSFLGGQGFSNRLNVTAGDKTATDRLSGLQQLLSKLDKTNIG